MEEENNEEDVSGANSGGGSSGGGSSGGGGGGSGSGGGGSSGARGIDSSRQSAGELRGARKLRQGQQRQGGAGNYQHQGGGGSEPAVYLLPNQENNEQPMNSPTIVPIPVPGYGGYGFGGAPAVAPAYGGVGGWDGLYTHMAAMEASKNACAAIDATKDSEGDIKDSIMQANTQRMTADLNLHNRLCEAEKAGITAGYESRLESKEMNAALTARIEECCCDMKIMNMETNRLVSDKFCDLERRMDKDLFGLERRMDKEFDEIRTREAAQREADLRERLSDCRLRENNASLAGSIVSALQCAGIVPTPASTHAH